ncbi:unnamed protein product [Adineta steineri]|uniref:ABC-type glutathione-S-conjugate transporter n=1 Tax=Adineta steineri TaxID=433720 RepID=A0A819H7W5_9BILA|nr:unnamed protein product [Adineta steineri]
MIRLCETPLWDKNITKSSYPYLTECFRNTILQWVPMGIFWLILPLWIYMLIRERIKSQPIPISGLFITKMILAVQFLLIEIFRIIYYAVLSTEQNGQAICLTSVLYIITVLTILWLMNYDRLKSIYASGLLFVFWLLVSLAIVPDIIDYSIKVQQQIGSKKLWIKSVSIWIHFILALGSFIANCFAEKYVPIETVSDKMPVVPELYVNFLSRIFCTWVTPLIVRGYKTPLTENDCWQLPISEQTVTVAHQVQNCMKGINMQTTSMSYENISTANQIKDENRNLLNNLPVVDIKIHEKKTVFWRALFGAFIDKIISGGLIKFVHDLFQLTGPLVLKLFLNFFTDPTKPKWLGIFYAILISTMVFCQVIFLRAYFHCQFLVGLRFRSAITGLVYRKSLKLSNSSRHASTTGEIINLMSIDASHFADITTQLHMLWSAPFQILVILILLYQQMQLAIIPGVALLLIMIPINLFIQRIQKQLTSKQMTVKDERIKMMNEILNGIRVLKLYGWEPAFIRLISRIRQKELGFIRQQAVIGAISSILWTFTPILVSITTFATYVLLSDSNILTAEKAFVSLALFNLLRGPLVSFPNMINSVAQAGVSSERIGKFLTNDEVDKYAVDKIPIELSDGNAINIENGSFRWSTLVDDHLVLKNINVQIHYGSLVALVGMVGSGKSSILSALLGEMIKVNGHVRISGNIAYVSQTAWILNATLKENILFGKDFDKKLYDQVIEACALKQDLVMLPAGDETEIGEKGINLSGGQRQRVSLARALYSNADIYLLDDPLSAVDAHVGAHIFRHVIGSKGLLNGKTRILVTHGVSHLHKCDDIIVISQGEIIDHGLYSDLIKRSNILREFIHSSNLSNKDQHETNDERRPSISTPPIEIVTNPLEITENKEPEPIQEEKKKLIQKETVQTGSVTFRVFWIYIRACKLPMIILITIFFCLTTFTTLCTNIWLSKWTDKSTRNDTSSILNNRIHDLTIYSILGLAQGFLAFIMQLILKLAAYIAGRKLHWIVLIGVLRAPMSFFDTTPIGRIINRFAKEIDSVDTALPNAFSQSLTVLITVVATLVILIYGSWFAIFVLVPLAILFAYIQRMYVSSSRQLRRLDSVTRSSIYANFGETIQGLSSIRAYHVQQRFIDMSDKFMDRNQSCQFASSVANRWLGVRLEMIASLIILFTAVASVFIRDHLTAGTVGLMITYALQITNSLNLLVRMSSEIETNIVSVERINEYAELDSEAPWEILEKKPSPHWPTNGSIQIKDLSTRYRENLQLVLKDITVNIEHGDKIGIIGRTGSGKSSLCLAFFRIIEPTTGTIIIDNVDIRSIGLHDLRSKITIIPQDAIVFAGTIRFNVDPFGNYSDAEIWTALQLVHMKERINLMKNGLSYLLAEGGQNMSAGERQLLCLARALLRKSQIIILDEATAAIDMETDRLIQLTIRSAFKNATVITIAHRLHTILDSTKILVLSDGCVQEYDEPIRLAANPNSAFTKLLNDANIHPSDITSTLTSQQLNTFS